MPVEAVAKLRCPVLLVAASRDDLVPAAQVQEAFARLSHTGKELLEHDGAWPKRRRAS